jgi:hypothetical protein
MSILQKQIELFGKTEEAKEFALFCVDNPNMIHSFPDEDYRNLIGINQSSLKDFRINQRRYHHTHVMGNKKPKTKAMDIGSLFHAAVLEPHTIHEKYISDLMIMEQILENRPDLANVRACKEYKAWAELQEANGVTVLSHEVFTSVDSMVQAVYAHPLAKNMLKNGTPEAVMCGVDPVTGLLLKGKADFLISDGYIIDMKSTEDASAKEFERSVYNLDYYVQAAFYLHLARICYGNHFKSFLYCAVEKSAPYEIAIYNLDDGALDAGERVMRRDLRMLRDSIEKNKWLGYGDGIQSITLPSYAWPQLENIIDG